MHVLSSYDFCRNSAESAQIMLAGWPLWPHLSVHRCNSSGQMPTCAAILRRVALTSRCSADTNRALFAAGGELRQRRNGRPVNPSLKQPFSEGVFAGLRDTPSLDEGSSDAASDT